MSLLFSCVTFEIPPPDASENGLLVARLRIVNLVPTEIQSAVRDVSVRVVKADGEARTVPLSPRGLLVLAGTDGEQPVIYSLTFTSTRTMKTRNQPWVDLPRSEPLRVEYRYLIRGGRLPAIVGATVVNMGVIEMSVFASTFSGEVSEVATGCVLLPEPARPPAAPLARLGFYDHVFRAFAREFGGSEWLAVPWRSC